MRLYGSDSSLASKRESFGFGRGNRFFEPFDGARKVIARKLRKRARREGNKEPHRIIFEERAAQDAEQRKLEEEYARFSPLEYSPFLPDDDFILDFRDDDFDPFED